MTAYHITCTTCRSRLKVKDESAVGLILSCPKCGSMVMVTAPEESNAAVEPVSASATERAFATDAPVRDSMQETVDASFDLPAELLEPPADQASAAVPSAPPSPPVDDEDLHATADLATTADLARPDFEATEAPRDVDAPLPNSGDTSSAEVGGPAPRPDQWISKETRQMRQWLLAGAAMVFGVIAALGLVIFLLSRQGDQSIALDSANQSQTSTPTPTSPQPAVSETELETDPTDVAAQPTDGDVKLVDPLPAIPNAAVPNSQPLDDANPAGPPDPLEGPTGEGPLVGPALPNDATPNPTAPDPLAPPSLSPAGSELLSPLPSDPARGAAADLLNDDKFDSLEAMIEAAAAPTVPTPLKDPDRETLYNRLKGVLDPPRRPAGMHIDAPAQMKVTIPRVESVDVTLQDFLRVMMDISTVPVTIDPEAVIYADVAPTTKVTCRQNDASIKTVIETAVTPLGVELAVGERHARLVVAKRESMVTFDFTVNDLATDAPQRQWLLATMKEVIQPGTWAPAGTGKILWKDDATLSVHQSRLGLFEAMHFLETLRVARKLPLQSKVPAERVATGTRRSRALARLSKLTTVNFRNPAPLEVVLEKLTEQTATQFVIDWEAIEAKGWNRRTEVPLQTDQESLAAALRLLLTPMELDYLVVDSNVVSITTHDAITSRRELAVHPVADLIPKGNDVDLALEDARKALGEKTFDPGTGNSLAFDPVSRSLIARLSPPDQRRLQALIDNMRIGE